MRRSAGQQLVEEITMGTWDVGPFDNDDAADFAGDLDDAASDERENLVRSTLKRAANAVDYGVLSRTQGAGH
jgi:hypothetical protein